MHFHKDTPKPISMRKCLVTGVSCEKRDLIRFVVDPNNRLIADIDQKLPGRGYWVKADRATIIKALKKNLFLKVSKKNVTIDANILSVVEKQIKQKIIQQISLSRKAGQAIFGFDKIKFTLSNNTINLLIQAIDGSSKEKKRILTKSTFKVLDDCLTACELGKAFGRDKVIHCAIMGNGFIEKIIFNSNRLNNLKNPVPHYNNMEISMKNGK